ncbi:hypothetical protein GCM10023340_13550 [Nocardioides marinquilinus]|uniref:MarR family transcriptional regulator n=1 Tax=Nocardioides marinquilinus TaxID=1210400 RepID=A0ABP9PDU1_9ACTN
MAALPIVYDGDPAFRDDLLAVVERVAQRAATARHYQHLAAGQWERSGAAAGAETRLKGIFYALRPCAVLHWMAATRGGDAGTPPVPPMNLGELFDQAPPPADVRSAVDELTARKAVTRELGTGSVPDPVRRFVETWLAVDAADLADRVGAEPEPDVESSQAARRVAADGFRSLLDRWAPA